MIGGKAMEYQLIQYSDENRIAKITLNSAPLNIMNIRMMEEINDALDHASHSAGLSAILFGGAGEKAFSAGVAIEEHTPELVGKMLTTFHDIFRRLAKTDLVTVARVQGHCLGGGLELAAMCDFVIASDNAKFGQPEIKLGCFPPVAAALFPSLIGRRQAERLMITGELIRAPEAATIGLVTRVCSRDELDDCVDKVVTEITSKSCAVIGLLRRAQPEWRDRFLDDLGRAERLYLEDLTKLHDMQEGIDAFSEKREPSWRHE
ncbi:MAG: enoyl-CoA hydratase/isomerase family protein [Candidatus Zixiibacteriota bacterium]